jgi:hypothetical protein
MLFAWKIMIYDLTLPAAVHEFNVARRSEPPKKTKSKLINTHYPNNVVVNTLMFELDQHLMEWSSYMVLMLIRLCANCIPDTKAIRRN